MSRSESALADVLQDEEVVPLGLRLVQKMPRPDLSDDPRHLEALASVTYGTQTPQGPDDPADDTER